MISKIFISLVVFIQAAASAPEENELSRAGLSSIVRVRVDQKVLRIPLELYIMGVLPSEMPASWPLEALKAQAVASRSFVLSQMEKRKNNDFDVESTTMDQVFRTENLTYKGQYKERLQKAIEGTRGEVLLEPERRNFPAKVQKTYFHSDCGGSTETSFFVWRTDEPLLQVQDRGCLLAHKSKWELAVSIKELEEGLKLFGIKDVQVATKSPSGRNSTLMVFMRNGEKELFLAETFRRLLGYNKIRSTYFAMTQENNKFVFKGRGHGHGVGMCQWGARYLAQQKYDYKKILAHYFPLSNLKNIKSVERPLFAKK